MTKAELITKIAEKTGNTKKETGENLDAVLETITEVVASGEKVTLVGFGAFSVVEKAARECKNPQTGDTIKVPAKKVPKFKAGKEFKEAVK